jgi:hypothetical protein
MRLWRQRWERKRGRSILLHRHWCYWIVIVIEELQGQRPRTLCEFPQKVARHEEALPPPWGHCAGAKCLHVCGDVASRFFRDYGPLMKQNITPRLTVIVWDPCDGGDAIEEEDAARMSGHWRKATLGGRRNWSPTAIGKRKASQWYNIPIPVCYRVA